MCVCVCVWSVECVCVCVGGGGCVCGCVCYFVFSGFHTNVKIPHRAIAVLALLTVCS